MKTPSKETVVNSGDSACHLDAEMAELILLLPAWWLGALEAQAEARGRTAAQLVRDLIRDYLSR
jgi:hypothetical protein